jgi:hypothetical protein
MGEITITIPEWMVLIIIPTIILSTINTILEIKINQQNRQIKTQQNNQKVEG